MQIHFPDDLYDAIAESHADVAGYLRRLVAEDLGVANGLSGCFAAAEARRIAGCRSPAERDRVRAGTDRLKGVLRGSSLAEICEDRHAGLR